MRTFIVWYGGHSGSPNEFIEADSFTLENGFFWFWGKMSLVPLKIIRADDVTRIITREDSGSIAQ